MRHMRSIANKSNSKIPTMSLPDKTKEEAKLGKITKDTNSKKGQKNTWEIHIGDIKLNSIFNN